MNKQTATKTAPVIQKVNMIVPSILPQFDATGVHHHGLQKWKAIDATMTNAKIIATNTYCFLLNFLSLFLQLFHFYNNILHCESFSIRANWLSKLIRLMCQLDAVLKFNLDSSDSLLL